MRIYRFDRLNGLDHLTLHYEPTPEPQHGEVLVMIRAVSLNYRDVAIPLGRYVWNAKPNLVPCSDAAGEIVSVGEGVNVFRPGDRVISVFHPRWFGGRPPLTTTADAYGSGQGLFEEFVGGHSPDFAWPYLDESEASGLCYTSGTTGAPKASFPAIARRHCTPSLA
jgi:NADPH:quinone reductase-like Zn-dependent oxidoreductase